MKAITYFNQFVNNHNKTVDTIINPTITQTIAHGSVATKGPDGKIHHRFFQLKHPELLDITTRDVIRDVYSSLKAKGYNVWTIEFYRGNMIGNSYEFIVTGEEDHEFSHRLYYSRPRTISIKERVCEKVYSFLTQLF